MVFIIIIRLKLLINAISSNGGIADNGSGEPNKEKGCGANTNNRNNALIIKSI